MLVVTTAPSQEPITPIEVKAHCRIDTEEEQSLLELYIAAARADAEGYCQRAFVTTGFRYTLDYFPAGGILLPRPNIQGAPEITYRNVDGDLIVLDDEEYELLASGILDGDWPHTDGEPEGVTIDFDAGFGLAVDVPKPIKVALLYYVAEFYANRENFGNGVLPDVVKRLLDPFRMHR